MEEKKEEKKIKKGTFWVLGFVIIVVLAAVNGFWWISLTAIVFVIVLFLLVWFWLAPTNRFFTFVKEGTAKIIVKGDKFEKILLQWEGKTLYKEKETEDYSKWDVIDDEEGKEPKHLFGGLRYYGIWPIYDVYGYRQSWTGVEENGAIIRHIKELLDYVLLKDTIYFAEIVDAEDKNLLPLRIQLLITLRVTNAYKVLFKVHNAIRTVITQTTAAGREIATKKPYEKWIEDRDMAKYITRKLGKKIEDFKKEYGIDYKLVQVKQIDPPEQFRKETLGPYFASLRKKAAIIDAEATQESIQRVYSKIQEFGDLGKLVRLLESVEKSDLAASLSVQAIPGLQEAFRGIFGKQAEDVTREEVRQLRETIEKFLQKQESEKKPKKPKK